MKSVEVSVDGGATWKAAKVEHRDDSPFGWRTWTYRWRAAKGTHMLYVRSTDMKGAVQPTTSEGAGKTAAQRVDFVAE